MERKSMIQLNIEEEWKILNYEMFENKPKEEPFPEEVVKKRELLLLAQCVLADYQVAKSEREKAFWGKIYSLTIKSYFAK